MRFKPPSPVQIPQRVLSLLVGLLIAGSLGLVAIQSLPSQRSDPFYSGYIEDTQRLIRKWKAMPPGRFRDEKIRAAENNLAWAAEYERTGVNTDADETDSSP